MHNAVSNEALFSNIVHHSPDSIVIVDGDGYVRFINAATERLFQRPRHEIVGEVFGFPLVAGESEELDVLHGDGSLANAEMRVAETHWDGKKAYLAMLRDITGRKKMETDLREARDELQTLYRCAPLAIVALRPDWGVTLWNPAAERIFGWGEGEVVGNPYPLTPPPLATEIARLGDQTLAGQTVVGRETRHLHKDGSTIDVSVSMAPLHDEGRGARGLICIIEDISARLRADEKLRLSGRIFENTQEGIVVTDAQACILTVNSAFVALTGYSEAEAVGRNPKILASGRHDPAFYAEMWQSLLRDGQWSGEIWNRRKNGEIYPEWLNISSVRDVAGEVTHYVAIFSDISRIKAHEEQLRRLAHFDILTGLPNRFLFRDHLRLALAQAARNQTSVGVLFLDLDRFKSINDTLGHGAGDRLLEEAGQRLADCVRGSDTVSRFGGDEFNIVLTDVDGEAGATSVAQKILNTFAAPFLLDGKEVFVTTSIGISLCPRDGDQPEQLTRAADVAMYQAKEHGGNAFRMYRPDPHVAADNGRFALEQELRGALSRNELEVHYQPLLGVDTRHLAGFEALVRWDHPERGLTLPGDFLPVAAASGLSREIDRWVLRRACRQNKAWQDAGHGCVPVAVNLAAGQLLSPGFVADVAATLAETGLAARWLELDVHEEALADDLDETIRVLGELKTLGVRLSIDHFGAGLSCLSRLRDLPVDSIKIDRSLLADVAANHGSAAISRAIVSLAKGLRLRVVAAGIESPEQLAVFNGESHCDAQGFYLGRPLPAAESARLLSPPPSRAGSARPLRVAIVDDHTMFRKTLRRVLEMDPHIEVVAEAADGVEAVELLGRVGVDVMCMDIRMPRMDGLQATRRIVAADPSIRIIGLSSHADHLFAQAMLDAGAAAFVTKSDAAVQLRETIHSLGVRDTLPPGGH